jgi:lipopolysaccharide transport protein LptA
MIQKAIKNIVIVPVFIGKLLFLGSDVSAAEEIQAPAIYTPTIQPPTVNITLNSDRSTLNGKTGIFEHCGNAILTQGGLKLMANCLVGKKNVDGSYAYIHAKGNPASLIRINQEKRQELEVSAENIEYNVPKKSFNIEGTAQLKLAQKQSSAKEPGYIQILAKKIIFDDKETDNKKINAEGSPLKISLVRSNNTELEATAKSLYYNSGSSDLRLSKDVIANLALGQITAGVFEYNSETQISSFEKSNNEQIEIIQSKKQPQ